MELDKDTLERLHEEATRDLAEAERTGRAADIREARFFVQSVDRRLRAIQEREAHLQEQEAALADLNPRELASRIRRW